MVWEKAKIVVRICAIHQPNFFPWLGYFDKINRSDVFVLMDDVDYPRSGSGGMGSWTNRVLIKIQGEAKWIGSPIDKKTGNRAIQHVRISPDPRWKSKFLRTLEMNYKRAPRYSEAMDVLEPLVVYEQEFLAAYNSHAIAVISSVLGLKTEFVRQSTLDTQHSSTNLLIEICQKNQADTYLAGGGASGYQENEKFGEAGIDLLEQSFVPFRYGAQKDFIPGLSVIDFLMHSPIWDYKSALIQGRTAQ